MFLVISIRIDPDPSPISQATVSLQIPFIFQFHFKANNPYPLPLTPKSNLNQNQTRHNRAAAAPRRKLRGASKLKPNTTYSHPSPHIPPPQSVGILRAGNRALIQRRSPLSSLPFFPPSFPAGSPAGAGESVGDHPGIAWRQRMQEVRIFLHVII